MIFCVNNILYSKLVFRFSAVGFGGLSFLLNPMHDYIHNSDISHRFAAIVVFIDINIYLQLDTGAMAQIRLLCEKKLAENSLVSSSLCFGFRLLKAWSGRIEGKTKHEDTGVWSVVYVCMINVLIDVLLPVHSLFICFQPQNTKPGQPLFTHSVLPQASPMHLTNNN